MKLDSDLKEIQHKVYMSYFQDGLWDIMLGIFLIAWGIMVITDYVAIMSGAWIACYFVILGLKRLLTYPRTGYIRITGARRQHMKMVIAGLVVFALGLMSFFLFIGENRPAWLTEYFMFFFGVMFTVIILLLAYWWQVTRWYAYAGLVFISFVSYQFVGTPLELSFIVPGGIIVLVGAGMLYRFLRKYPRVAPGEPDVTQ